MDGGSGKGGLNNKPKVNTTEVFSHRWQEMPNCSRWFTSFKATLDVKFHAPLYLTPLQNVKWGNKDAWFNVGVNPHNGGFCRVEWS